jgi:hypothetical protein
MNDESSVRYHFNIYPRIFTSYLTSYPILGVGTGDRKFYRPRQLLKKESKTEIPLSVCPMLNPLIQKPSQYV